MLQFAKLGASMDDVLEFKGWGLGFRAYLNPKSIPIIIAVKAIIFPTLGMQVGIRVRVQELGFGLACRF